jgi:hypothetical protein
MMNPTSLLLDCITRTIRSIEIRAAHVSVALAPKATWPPKYPTRPDSSSSSSGTRTARRSLHRPGQLVERDGEGPRTVMIRSRADQRGFSHTNEETQPFG